MGLSKWLGPVAFGTSLVLSAISAHAVPVTTQLGTLATVTTYQCVDQSCDPSTNPLLTLSTLSGGPTDGGIGQPSAAVQTGAPWPNPTAGSAAASATLSGSLALPTLRAGAVSASGNWLGGSALAVQQYTYGGLGETISLNWMLDGNVVNPDEDDVTGLVIFAGLYLTSGSVTFPDLSDPTSAAMWLFNQAIAQPTDDVREYTADGPVDDNQTISLEVENGDEFLLVMGLLAGAGGAGATGESMNTLTATIVGEPIIMATLVPVPEPGTLALFGLGLAGLGFARRRKAA